MQQYGLMRVSEPRHNRKDVTTLGLGYPDTLKLLRMNASRYWYMGMYISGRGFIKQSKKCENCQMQSDSHPIGMKIVSMYLLDER